MGTMRSSAQPLPRDAQQATPRGRSARPRTDPAGRPVQLELFGSRPVAVTAPASQPAPADPNALRFHLLRRLNRLTGGRLRSLELTDNRKTILSVRAGRIGNRAPFELRIHHSFTQAPEEVLQAVATFVESRRGSDQAREALVLIREHFSAHRAKARSRKIVLQPEGVALDLREVMSDLNERYFENRLDVQITWGKASTNAASCRRRRSASLQLGSYSYEDRLIRLHRVLDHPDVPRYVVEAVVYHEMLHADMPPEIHNGKRQYHTPEFRKRERHYRNLTRAERWIGENMPELLKARAAMARGRKR
jgi:predicted metal-dependent hydrolase